MYPPDIIIMAHIKIFVNKENKYFYMCSGGLTGKKCRYGDVPASFVFAFLLIGVIAYVNLVCNMPWAEGHYLLMEKKIRLQILFEIL